MNHYTLCAKSKIYKKYLSKINDIYFTVREIEVISCIIHNKTNQNISATLSISTSTVCAHIYNIRIKLNYIAKNKIINFAEQSGKLSFLNQIYVCCLLDSILIQNTNQINMKQKQQIFYVAQFGNLTPEEMVISNLIINKLKLLGINLVENKQNQNISFILSFNSTTLKNNKNTRCFQLNLGNFQGEKNKSTFGFSYKDNHFVSLCILIKEIYKSDSTSQIIDLSLNKIHNITKSYNQNYNQSELQTHQKLYNKKIILYIIFAILLTIIIYFKFIMPNYYYNNKQLLISSSYKSQKSNIFIDRKKYLKDLHKKVKNNKIVIISGIPGVGKSSLALKYSHQCDKKGKIVVWFDASDIEKIYNEFNSLAQEININTQIKKEVVLKLLYKKIQQQQKEFIFIFDNLKNEQVLEKFLINIPINVNIIITTRNNNLLKLKKSNNSLFILPFNKGEAISFLQQSLNDYRSSDINISKLVKNIGLLPYDLSKAILYLKQDKFISIDHYINLVKKDSIINLMIHDIQENTLAFDILKYISYIDGSFVDISTLQLLLNQKQNNNIIKAINFLESYSLITFVYDKGKKGIKIHNLVQADILLFLKQQDNLSYNHIQKYLIKTFNKHWPTFEVSKVSNYSWSKVKPFVPHIKILLKNVNDNSNETVQLLSKLGHYYNYKTYDFLFAKEWYELSYKKQQKIILSDKPKWYYNLLLSMCTNSYETGDIQNAFNISRELLIEAKKISKQKPSVELSDALNAIGVIYFEHGDVKLSLQYFCKALKTYHKLKLKNHIFPFIRYKNNMARAYYALNNITEGIIHSRDALKASYKIEIPPSRGVIISLIHLSYGLYKKGDIDNNFIHSAEALDISKKVFKDRPHRFYAQAYNNMGLAHFAKGDLEKSQKCFTMALNIYKKVLGNKLSGELAKVYNNLGAIHIKKGNIKKSIYFYKKILNIYSKIYKDTNRVEYAIVLSNMSLSYYKILDYDKALELSKRAFNIFQAISGENNNADYALCIQVLSRIYFKLNQIETAFKLIDKTIEIQNKDYIDKNHPSIAESYNIMHNFYYQRGDFGKSLQNLLRCHELLKKYHQKNYDKLNDIINKSNLSGLLYKIKNKNISLLEKKLPFSNKKFLIRQVLQENLNTIQNLSAKGNWSNNLHFFNGVKYYTSENYLKTILGQYTSKKDLIIAKLLCLEAINLGITFSLNDNYTCLLKFIENNQFVTDIALNSYTEYFIDNKLLELSKIEFQSITAN